MPEPVCVSTDWPDPLKHEKFIRHVSRRDVDKPIAVAPLKRAGDTIEMVYATNAAHLGYMIDLVGNLEHALPKVKFDEEDLGPEELVNGDHLRALSLPGHPMMPLGTPNQMSYAAQPADRLATSSEVDTWATNLKKWCADQELPRAQRTIPWPALRAWKSERHRTLFDWICSYFFEYACWADVWEPLESSTSYPFFDTERTVKETHMEEGPANLKLALGSSTSKFAELHAQGCAWVIAQGERLQQDPVVRTDTGFGPDPGKVRMIYTFNGEYVPANKDVSAEAWIDGQLRLMSFARMRRRHVNAFPKGPASWDQAIMAAFEKVAMKRAAFAWKHTSKPQLDQKLARFKWAILADAKEFDSQHPRCMADRFNYWYGKATVPEMELVSSYSDHSPLLLKNGAYQPLYKYTGDPLDPSTCDTFIGQISGRPTNPRFNRLSGTWLALITYEEVLANLGKAPLTYQRFVDILEGRDADFGVLDAGDDMVILFNKEDEFIAYKQLLAAGWTPYIKLESDPRGTFLGWHVVRTKAGRMRVVPNLNSRLIKFWTPEYSFGSHFRPLAALGFSERDVAHYAFHPSCTLHQGVERATYKQSFSTDLPTWMLTHVPALDSAATRGADFMYILNPDGWQYGKYDPEDLSDEVRSKRMFKVPAEVNAERYSWALLGTKIISDEELAYMLSKNGAQAWLDIKYVPPALYNKTLNL
jgi:hypothetical protein